jgi:hypothetical protein
VVEAQVENPVLSVGERAKCDEIYDDVQAWVGLKDILETLGWKNGADRKQYEIVCQGTYLGGLGNSSASMGCSQSDNDLGPGLFVVVSKLRYQVLRSSPRHVVEKLPD